MTTTLPNLHIFGIRHHGPGSAHSVQRALVDLQPDIILVEGPADANDMLHWLGHAELEPPVSLVIYSPDQPRRAAQFPFAEFSPEYQAIRFGVQNDIPVRFMDLPQANMLASTAKLRMPEAEPFVRLAQAAGHISYEQWWNQMFEQRRDNRKIFSAIQTMIGALRAEAERERLAPDEMEAEELAGLRLADQREAHMRQSIRAAQAEGHHTMAIVCGAWHGPAVTASATNFAPERATSDAELLANMPRIETEAAWVPWTYGRLSTFAGYGAGVPSPGWYHHLWTMTQQESTPTDISIHWLTKVANLLRDERLDASAAHVIESVRLAEALAALRGIPYPGLLELNEATLTVICGGDPKPVQLIQKKLIVGERMGAVPSDSPMVPLQRDLYEQQRQLRLRPEPEQSILNLDLRNEMHLKRSHLLHRLRLLNIPWGEPMPIRGKSGTYREVWKLLWKPELSVRVIEANVWGNTVRDAAAEFAQDSADKADDLPALTLLLDQIILAELPDVIKHLMERIEEQSATSSDVPHMMEALPPLVRVLRYGSVRQTDTKMIQHVVDGLLTRICVGLPVACRSLNDDAAADMYDRLNSVHSLVQTLRDQAHGKAWTEALTTLADQEGMHGLIAGRCCRLLLDGSIFSADEVKVRLEGILSQRTLTEKASEQLMQTGFWLEGFLKGSGLLLLHDRTLWQLIDQWVVAVEDENFLQVLPLLRRTFTSFNSTVRQQIGDRVRHGEQRTRKTAAPVAFDHEQANAVLPMVARLLGIEG